MVKLENKHFCIRSSHQPFHWFSKKGWKQNIPNNAAIFDVIQSPVQILSKRSTLLQPTVEWESKRSVV